MKVAQFRPGVLCPHISRFYLDLVKIDCSSQLDYRDDTVKLVVLHWEWTHAFTLQKYTWTNVSQATSGCSLSDHISMFCTRSDLYLVLSTCDQFTHDGCLCMFLCITSKKPGAICDSHMSNSHESLSGGSSWQRATQNKWISIFSDLEELHVACSVYSVSSISFPEQCWYSGCFPELLRLTSVCEKITWRPTEVVFNSEKIKILCGP